MIEFNCSKCGHPFRVASHAAGKTGTCKHCKSLNKVPDSPIQSEVVEEEFDLDFLRTSGPSGTDEIPVVEAISIPVEEATSTSRIDLDTESVNPPSSFVHFLSRRIAIPIWGILSAGVVILGAVSIAVMLGMSGTSSRPAVVTVTESANQVPAVSKAESNLTDPIEHDGITWRFAGTPKPRSSLRPFSTVQYCYQCGDPDLRLIVCMGTPRDRVYEQITAVEKNFDGTWLQHGLTADWWKDGGYGWSEYRHGKQNGEMKAWHPNGKLRFERTYLEDKMHGRCKAWNTNGEMEYDVTYVMDKEVEIHFSKKY